MKKKDTTQGNNENVKKPFYKKWWFWVIVVVIASAIVGGNATKDPDNKDSPTSTIDSSQGTEIPETTSPAPLSDKEIIQKAIEDVIGAENLITFNYIPENNFSLISFKGKENLTHNMTVGGMYLDIFNILKKIQSTIDTDVDFGIMYSLQDQYGNVDDVYVIKATFKKETIKKINFENAISDNIPEIADEWWNHTAVNKK